MSRSTKYALTFLFAALLGGASICAQAARYGGRVGGGGVRSTANTSVTHNLNTNTNVNRNVNVNVNRDVDVHGGYYGGRGYYGGGCCYHPAATAAAVTAATVVTAAVVGSMVNTLPPSCGAVSVSGITYQQCGNTWYQPQFSGPNVTYVVVNPPR